MTKRSNGLPPQTAESGLEHVADETTIYEFRRRLLDPAPTRALVRTLQQLVVLGFKINESRTAKLNIQGLTEPLLVSSRDVK